MTDSMPTINLLVVDDEAEPIRRAFADHLGLDGEGSVVCEEIRFRLKWSQDLDQAWDLITYDDGLDCVLLDVFFPGSIKNGLWLLEKVNQMTTDLAVVLFSQDPSLDVAHTAGYLQADSYVPKPRALTAPADAPQLDEVAKEIIDILREVSQAVLRKRKQPELHDRTHLDVANAFLDYEKDEQSYPATVAYYLFENEAISRTVADLSRRLARSLEICDLGCGTGRIEEALFDEGAPNINRVVAVDFSAAFLRVLRDKPALATEIRSGRLQVERGSAERLAMLKDATFDLVILGFGVPSYTRTDLSVAEAARICRPGGQIILSVYNDASCFYGKGAEVQGDDRAIAAVLDRDRGRLIVGPDRSFRCQSFNCESFGRILRRESLSVLWSKTFPTLYVTLPKKGVAALPDGRHPEGVPLFPFAHTFSRLLFDLDKTFSDFCPGSGHYGLFLAEKPKDLQ